LRAQYRTVANSRRRSATAPATAAASIENIVDSDASDNISAHADAGTSVSIIARPPCDDRTPRIEAGDSHPASVGTADEPLMKDA
jgi:hypothetical protein